MFQQKFPSVFYKLFSFIIIILILSPKLIRAQLTCADVQHEASNTPHPGIPGAAIVVINNSGHDLNYVSSSLATGEWVNANCSPEKFRSVPNGQTLIFAAISKAGFLGISSGTKGSCTYNVLDKFPPSSITFLWDTPIGGNTCGTKDYDATNYIVTTVLTGPGNERCTIIIRKNVI